MVQRPFGCRNSDDLVSYPKGKVTSGAILVRITRPIWFERIRLRHGTSEGTMWVPPEPASGPNSSNCNPAGDMDRACAQVKASQWISAHQNRLSCVLGWSRRFPHYQKHILRRSGTAERTSCTTCRWDRVAPSAGWPLKETAVRLPENRSKSSISSRSHPAVGMARIYGIRFLSSNLPARMFVVAVGVPRPEDYHCSSPTEWTRWNFLVDCRSVRKRSGDLLWSAHWGRRYWVTARSPIFRPYLVPSSTALRKWNPM